MDLSTLEQLPWRLFCKVLLYICRYCQYLYLFQYVHFGTYIYYILTTYLLHSFHLCCFSYFSELLFIIHLLTTEMLGIDHG